MQGSVARTPVIIVPDSNALFGDPFLAGRHGAALLEAAKSPDTIVAISPVVRAELLRQYDDALDNAQSEIEGAINKAVRQRVLKLDAVLPALRGEIRESRAARSGLLLPLLASGALELDWPAIDSRELAERDLARSRPFVSTSSGSIGMRDALIWASVLELGENYPDHHLVFVSNDKGFYDGDDAHEDLLEDLDAMGFERASLTIARTIPEALLRIEAIRQEATVKELAVRAALQAFAASLDGEPPDAAQVGLPPDVYEPIITYAELGEIEEIGTGDPAIATVTVLIGVDGSMESYIYFGDDQPEVELWGGEIDDHYVTVHADRSVQFECEIDYNVETHQAAVVDFTITGSSTS